MVVYQVNKLASYSRGATNNINKIMEERGKHKYKCKCGHSVIIRPMIEKGMCTWCNHYVFKDKQKQKEHDIETEKKEALLKFRREIRKRI